jgi:chromate transporter
LSPINPALYFILFLKASLFSTGGLANLPSLHQDLIEHSWATEANFGQSVAIGQLSPGPNGLWVICLGYLTFGWLGALLALVAIIIPPFLVLPLELVFGKIEHKDWVQGLMRGMQLASVGLILAVSWAIVSSVGLDWRNFLIAGVAFLLAFTNRINVLLILALAGLAGYLLYGL